MDFKRQTSPHGNLMALSTMKDEGPYVVEWVAHHLAIGFTQVMVYTNDCSDGTDTILKRLEALDIGVYHRENVIPEGMKPHPSMLKLAADEELVPDGRAQARRGGDVREREGREVHLPLLSEPEQRLLRWLSVVRGPIALADILSFVAPATMDRQEVLEVVHMDGKAAVVLDASPFYAEMGGQLGDTGTLLAGAEIIPVLNTQQQLVGVITQSDLIAALFNSKLS